MTATTQTSIDAYTCLKNTIVMTRQKGLVLSALMRGSSFTYTELSKKTGVRNSSLTGRVNELKQEGLVREDTPRKCSVTGVTCKTWRRT